MDDRVIGFDGVTEYLTAKQERALGHLQTYYGPFRPRFRKTTKKGFTGRFYDDRVAASAAAPDHFTVDDFLAPSLLSTSLSGDAVASLLAIREDLDEALGKCPPRDFALADATDDQLATDAPLDVLYWKIRQINGLGPTRASKLLAAKRPHLIPVRDSKVSSILGNPRQWWTPWRDLIRTDELQDALDPIRAAAGATLPKAISMLRLLDVILWCEADQRHL